MSRTRKTGSDDKVIIGVCDICDVGKTVFHCKKCNVEICSVHFETFTVNIDGKVQCFMCYKEEQSVLNQMRQIRVDKKG
jgi:hypothetical protein